MKKKRVPHIEVNRHVLVYLFLRVRVGRFIIINHIGLYRRKTRFHLLINKPVCILNSFSRNVTPDAMYMHVYGVSACTDTPRIFT